MSENINLAILNTLNTFAKTKIHYTNIEIFMQRNTGANIGI